MPTLGSLPISHGLIMSVKIQVTPPTWPSGGSRVAVPNTRNGKLPNVGIFGASIYDNPHLDQREIGRLESIYPEGSVQRRIRLGGEWLPGLSGARAYPSFDRRVHVRPQPPITPRRPLAWYWDFNVEPMVSGIGQRHMKLFRVYR